MPTLSIVIPVYNEARTIREILEAVERAPLPDGMQKQIIVVNDASTDGTGDILKAFETRYTIVHQEKNQGKGAALRRGFRLATGDFIVIQDADLECDPKEYPMLLEPLMAGKADVVFGSRFMGGHPHLVQSYRHTLGNRFLTFVSNLFSNLNLTDMETCYKTFTRQALLAIRDELTSDRFGIEPEMTARIAKKRLRVFEVGISYNGRSYAEGKKINWKDGVSAIWCIIKFNLF